MVPPALREAPHLSYTQIDLYLRCPLRYKLQYVDRLEPAFVPAALVFGSGIHGAAAFFARGVAQGAAPCVADVQGVFETMWTLETTQRPVRFGERDSKEGLLELGRRMLAVLVAAHDPTVTILAVEAPFRVPLIDPEIGAILERDLVGTLDRIET
jgi:putative RecB family exonuclease